MKSPVPDPDSWGGWWPAGGSAAPRVVVPARSHSRGRGRGAPSEGLRADSGRGILKAWRGVEGKLPGHTIAGHRGYWGSPNPEKTPCPSPAPSRFTIPRWDRRFNKAIKTLLGMPTWPTRGHLPGLESQLQPQSLLPGRPHRLHTGWAGTPGG